MKKIITIFVILILLGCSSDPQPNEMKFRTVNNVPVLPVEINGKMGSLLVDTGASQSIIHSGASQEYGFTLGKRDDQFFGIGGGANTFDVWNLKMTYRDSTINNDFIALDLTDVKRNIGVVGILGSDWLNKNNIIIDYSNKTLRCTK